MSDLVRSPVVSNALEVADMPDVINNGNTMVIQ